MKISKPKNNQILIEDDALKGFNLEVESKTGLAESEFDDNYEVLMFAYRVPGMDASKQLFYGNPLSILTIYSSITQNLLSNNVLTEEMLDDVVKSVKQFTRESRE